MKTTASITEFPNTVLSVCRVGMILFLSLLAPGVWAGTNQSPWFCGALVGMEVGPTGAQFAGGKHAPDYARNFNGAEIAQRCAAANAEYLVLWVRDGDFTFHDSKQVPRPASFGDRDVLREAVEEGRNRGQIRPRPGPLRREVDAVAFTAPRLATLIVLAVNHG